MKIIGKREKGGLRLLVAASGMALLAAACGSSKGSATAATTGAGAAAGDHHLGAGHRPARLFPQHHPCPGPGRRAGGHLRQGPGARQAGRQSKTFNAGPAETEAHAERAPSTSPSSARARRSTPSASRTAPCRSSPGPPPAAPALVIKPSITSVDQLKGKTIATPQLGNTQDVALRAFLKSKGFKTDTQGGGDVHVTPAGQLPDDRHVQAGDRSTAPGCPSPTSRRCC